MAGFTARLLRRLPQFGLFVAALGVSGCVDTAAEVGAGSGAAPRPHIAALPGVSPRGAAIELASVEGPPPEVAARFKEAFTSAAAASDVAFAAPAAASYRLRGYLTAAGQGATRLAYVWDIFDRNGKRLQRLADDVPTRAGVAGWDGLDDKAIADIARAGAQELAAFLSNTPEAVAAAQGATAGASVVAREAPTPVVGRALGFAQAR